MPIRLFLWRVGCVTLAIYGLRRLWRAWRTAFPRKNEPGSVSKVWLHEKRQGFHK